MNKVEKIIEKTAYFCRSCGDLSETPGNCPRCEIEFSVDESYVISRECYVCNITFLASPGFFDVNPNCKYCCNSLSVKFVNNEASHFKIGSSWDGKPRGPIIMEKNNQLKKKHAGYSYESHRLREKINQQAQQLRGVSEK